MTRATPAWSRAEAIPWGHDPGPFAGCPATRQTVGGPGRVHSFFILCKKSTKNQKQMFIFYVSLTLYKLFDNCRAENNGVFSDSCYFCNLSVCRTRCVAGESERCLCPHQDVRSLPEVVPCLQNLPYYSSFGVLSGSGPKSQWDPWPMALVGPRLTEWPAAIGGTTCGYWCGSQLLTWPGAILGTRGCRWDPPWLTAQPVVVGVARGCPWDP